jgi:intein/homing endonuclease
MSLIPSQKSNLSQESLLDNVFERLHYLEQFVNSIGNDSKAAKKRRFATKTQGLVINGLTRALCIETIDPWKLNRVRYFHPVLHQPEARISSLPFASPISSMGGFDDCGLNWVPPAGSSIMIMYEMGNTDRAFYIGTSWNKDRGSNGNKLDKLFPSLEYQNVYKGHRKGYLLGPDDESQVYPPWNTESYNSNDIKTTSDFTEDPNEQKRTTYPNIYGFKTPEKHMFKMVDGNAKCNRRWKRLEILSGCGNWMIFKDDHLHYGGQWSNPECSPKPGGASLDICSKHKSELPYFSDFHGTPLEENSDCEGKKQSSKILGGHSSTPCDPETKYCDSNRGTNKFFKHRNECRPYKGPGTPQNNSCDLPQSGIQFLSISGHSWVMDDSVEEPRGKPTWERSTQNFDFGCNDKFLGRCVASSQKIPLANGEIKTAEELIDKEFELISIVEGKLKPVKSFAKFNAYENVYKLTTKMGNSVVRNSDHPFWVAEICEEIGSSKKMINCGWKKLKDLRKGMFIACPKHLPFFGNSLMNINEVKLLGYLISDKFYKKDLSKNEDEKLTEMNFVANEYGFSVKEFGKNNFKIQFVNHQEIGKRHFKNKVISFLRKHKILNLNNKNKKIPDCIFNLPKEQLSVFLSRLYSNGGWATLNDVKKRVEIGFVSKNKELVEDIQILLLRYGIHSVIRKKSKEINEKKFWNLIIKRTKDCKVFSEEIGIFGQEDFLNQLFIIANQYDLEEEFNESDLPDCLRWEVIDKIKELGFQPTVAIQVPSTQTFVTTLFEHNTYWMSATGHSIMLSDVEEESNLRGEKNYIQLKSANGNKIELNDHTVGDSNCSGCPPNYAGEKRGIHLESTSNHVIKMIDHMNLQCAPCRKNGGIPQAKATKAYIQIRSGYGLEMKFSDDFSQEKTQTQYIQITHPQCVDANSDETCNSKSGCDYRGPHFLRFQGAPKGNPGIVFLRAGGHSIRMTYDKDIVLVGDKECNPSDKFTYVSKNNIRSVEEVDFRYSGQLHILFAEDKILLLAGRDCPPDKEKNKKCKVPCLFNVIVARCPVFCPITNILHWTEKAMSERVFASANHPCQVPCDSGGCSDYESQMAAAQDPPCSEDSEDDEEN